MSAVMTDTTQPRATKLELPITRQMPRKLIVYFERYGQDNFRAYGHAFIRCGDRMLSIAFGGAHKADDVSLSYRGSAPTLWLAHTQFELTDKEAAEVERVFAPVGLTVDRGDAPL